MTQASTILIVDDQQLGREALEVALEPEGHNLLFASNGPEALAVACRVRPDLVLLDVMMPGMDGFEVCRRLRADPHLSEVPIVLVTALDDRQSRITGLEVGADDFVNKPFDRVELRARVRTIARLNRYRRLVQERTRFEWVVEQSDDGYVMLDDGDKVLYANPQARLYLDLPGAGQAPTTLTFLALAGQRYRLEPRELWAAWEVPAKSPLYLVRPETSISNALWLQIDMLDQGLPPGSGRLLRLRNVTAQIVARRDIRTFQTMVAHKLRTPLSHVLGSVQMLKDQLSTGPEQDLLLAELVGLAIEGAERLNDHVEDVLQYLHVRALARVDGRFALGELRAMVNRIAAEIGIRSISTCVPPELSEACSGLSRTAAELVLRELLENAHKFHPQQAPEVAVLVAAAGRQQVRVCIQDDGLRLPAEQLARAWSPYVQGEKNFTGEVAGMGLGLATVASLVWEAGGTCQLRNRSDRPGVVVELTLPLADVA